jgi:SAM-dependent methyltransferase
MDRDTRRRLGAWYTPTALVDFVLGQACRHLPDGPVRVLDPSCGDGRFLAAAGGALGSRASLFGVDLDADAVLAARRAVPEATVVHADALDHSWPASPFDVVVGNPPFLGQMSSRTSRGGRSDLGGGAYADTAALFLALSARLVRPDGGVVALVLPQSVLATRDAGPIRVAVVADAALTDLWVAGEAVFEAAVHTIVAVFRRGQPQGEIRRWFGPAFTPVAAVSAATARDLAVRSSWSFLTADLAGVPMVEPQTTGVIGDIATVTADFRDQYYGLVGAVRDDVEGPPLITSGLIDAGVCHWGTRQTRFAKQRFERPRVELAALSPALQTWAATRLVPKVLMATQTKVIEAIADPDGVLLPSVPVLTVAPHRTDDVWRVLAVLLAPSTSAWAATQFLGAGLTSSALKLSASQVRTLPLPATPWDDALGPLQSGDMAGFARCMNRAYRVADEPVTSWWLDRL